MRRFIERNHRRQISDDEISGDESSGNRQKHCHILTANSLN